MDGVSASALPPGPPSTEADGIFRLRLLRSRRVGVATYYRLLNEHGSAEAALDALPGIARKAGMDDYEPCPEGVVHAELAAAQKAGAILIWAGGPDYPRALPDIYDAPPVLWAKGRLRLTQRPALALIGARNASSLGLRMARNLGEKLGAAGHVIVSGLARGIDATAQEAAISTGTIAVVAGGVDHVYPRENAALWERIAQDGLILSEQPMGLAPFARHFPRRNRLISGTAQAVVVVEAAARSGSLMTARTALDQGREVMAVPGHPFDSRAAGCNMLIRDGAGLVRHAKDVLETLPAATQQELPLKPTLSERTEFREHERALAQPDPALTREARNFRAAGPLKNKHIRTLHQRILDRLSPSPTPEDDLLQVLNLAARDVAPALTDLELEGRIARAPGGMITLS